MRQALIITCFLLFGLPCLAQDPDSTMARMNDVKLSGDNIYGYCLYAVDSVQSSQTALEELIPRLNSFLKGKGFRFVSDRDHCPDSLIHYIVYTKAADYWRTLAFVELADLERIEYLLQEEYESKDVQASLDALKRALVNATTLDEIDTLIAESGVSDRIKTGLLTFDTDQRLVIGGYIVYYEAETGKVVEILTPRDENQQRYNARTGMLADRMAAPTPNIRWIYIDEPKPLQVR